MSLKHFALPASLGALLLMTACRIGEGLPDVGEPCDASDDCEGALGCVPTSVDNPTGPRVCMPPPDGWDDGRCKPYFLGDPDVICDCGCGAPDVDCANETAAACNQDLGLHCPDGQNPVADDNTRCE
jgi:hypothetical protein